MKALLNLWKPKNKFLAFIKGALSIMASIIRLVVLVLPFLGGVPETKEIFKWLWLGLILLNCDIFFEYKKAHENKVITPITTGFTILVLVYLYNYWELISVPVVIIGSTLVGIWEVFITMAVNKCIKFTENMKERTLNEAVIKNFAIGIIYATSVLLFVLGHVIESQTLFYVFGCIAVLFLSVSTLIGISQLSFRKKGIIGIVLFTVDIVSLIGLLVYLIFSIENADLQMIVLTITSALIGGVLTLAGVAWTIRKGDKDRKEELERRDKEKAEEERRRLVPYLKITTEENVPSLTCAEMCYINSHNSHEINCHCYTIDNFYVKNVSNSNILLVGIAINSKRYEFKLSQILEKDGICQIITTGDWNYIIAEPLDELYILVEDGVGNQYKVRCMFSSEKNGIRRKSEQGEEVAITYRYSHMVISVAVPEYIPKEN